MASHIRRGLNCVGVACALVAALARPVGADEVWVAPTLQQEWPS